MNEPTVSLIVPAHNAAAFLDSALASVAGQIHPFDEVVVIDDGSTDATAAVADVWRARLPLRVVGGDVNAGLGASRRTGIEHASGELIALLDADDVLLPDHLDVLLRTYRQAGGLVSPQALRWEPGSSVHAPRARRRLVATAQRRAILDHNFVQSAALFARADHDRAGGFSELRRMEDWDLWIRMVHAGVRVTTAPTPTMLYRLRPDSLSAGRANLPTMIERLPTYLPGLPPDERRVLRRTIRRTRARAELLAGEQAWRDGYWRVACTLWCRAAVRDRSLRGGPTGARSSVTLQAVADLVTLGGPGRTRRARAQRPPMSV